MAMMLRSGVLLMSLSSPSVEMTTSSFPCSRWRENTLTAGDQKPSDERILLMTSNLDALKKRVERLRALHLKALGSYHALEEMLKFTAPNVVGQAEAHLNAQAAGRYAGFYNTALQALITESHISLAKIFDDHKDALHITKLFKYAVGNKRALIAKHEAKLVDPEAAEELGEVYEGLSSKDQKEIESDLEQASDKIKRLKAVRDRKVAHEDLRGLDTLDSVSFADLSDLIALSEEILNTISRKFYGNAAMFSPYGDQVVEETKAFLQLLRDDYDRFVSDIPPLP
ncbi:hypothetical protein QN239_07005 [Mycolicibacterium sp. Y3]